MARLPSPIFKGKESVLGLQVSLKLVTDASFGISIDSLCSLADAELLVAITIIVRDSELELWDCWTALGSCGDRAQAFRGAMKGSIGKVCVSRSSLSFHK